MSKNVVNIEYILDELNLMFPNAGCELVYHNVYELTIAVVLSAQTTDKAVNQVTPLLFNKYPNTTSLALANVTGVEAIIKQIGLYRNKAKNIIQLAQKVETDFHGEIPNNFTDLISLPGVGRKTANVILAEYYHIPRIAVDTHVDRVSKRLGLVKAEASVTDVEEALMKLIPKDNWHHAHHLLLFFGRYHCLAKNPHCEECFYKQQCKKTS